MKKIIICHFVTLYDDFGHHKTNEYGQAHDLTNKGPILPVEVVAKSNSSTAFHLDLRKHWIDAEKFLKTAINCNTQNEPSTLTSIPKWSALRGTIVKC